MDRIKRNERLGAIARVLTTSPNRIYTLSHFCNMFGAAKSTVCEDVEILSKALEGFSLGQLETVTGAAGGVRYRPIPTANDSLKFIKETCKRLSEEDRVLPGGFLYMSDILSDPSYVGRMGEILAAQYYAKEPDFVLTMETKGIPVALMTARALNVPLVIARRDSKAYEGAAVKINYMAAAGRLETMSLERRAVISGQRALIIDDFFKGGGTAKGMADLMREFSVTVVGIGVIIATRNPDKKRVDGVKALMIMNEVEEDTNTANVVPAPWLNGIE